jgi:hypothetical protein
MDTVRKKKGLLQGVVILATWRDLEKSATSGLTENNQIDQGLAEVRKYNQENPKNPLAVKLRVWGGFWAPQWVMDESGGALARSRARHRPEEAQGRSRLGEVVSQALGAPQELLAAKYDGETLLREVAVTSCMMFTAEPFSIDTHDVALGPLRKAGMTDKNYKACLDGIVDDYKPWVSTRFETPLNPFRLTDGDKVEHDLQFTLDWMKTCKTKEPERCVFDDHDLDNKGMNKQLESIYDAMDKSKMEVEFQTGPEMPEDLEGTIALGVSKGATSIELYQDYKGFPDMTDAQLVKFKKALDKNAARIKD